MLTIDQLRSRPGHRLGLVILAICLCSCASARVEHPSDPSTQDGSASLSSTSSEDDVLPWPSDDESLESVSTSGNSSRDATSFMMSDSIFDRVFTEDVSSVQKLHVGSYPGSGFEYRRWFAPESQASIGQQYSMAAGSSPGSQYLASNTGGVPLVVPGPEVRRKDLQPFFWTSWFEEEEGQRENEPLFRPADHLEPTAPGFLYVDLTPIRYRTPNLTRISTSPATRTWIDRLVGLRPESTIELTVITVVDPAAFEEPNDRSQTIELSLDRIRKWEASGRPQPHNAWELRKDGEQVPDFLFASLGIRLVPTSLEGETIVALSFWHRGRAVGELRIPVCVAHDEDVSVECFSRNQQGLGSAPDPTISSLSGSEEESPDASLHFIDLYAGKIFGVFWCEKCPDPGYKIWQLTRTSEELAGLLRQQIRVSTGSKSTARTSAQVLWGNLFPNPRLPSERERGVEDLVDRERKAARVAFQRFLGSRTQNVASPPRIFSRFVYGKESRLLPIPLGLLYMPDILAEPKQFDDAALDPGDLLGSRFIVENPLPVRYPHDDKQCLSRWIVSLPQDADPTLKVAIEQISTPDRLGSRLGALAPWLALGEESEPLAVTLVSHHDPNSGTLFAFPQGPAVTVASVLRQFKPPSFVILGACSTSHAAVTGFAEAFNTNGVSTAIITNTDVEPKLAGDFLNCFGETLAAVDHIRGDSAERVFFRAMGCTLQRHGARALSFSLIGDGSLKLCPPIPGTGDNW